MSIPSIEQAVERLYKLHVGTIGAGSARHERPHKPVILLAALDLIARNQGNAQRIPWSQALRDRFAGYFDIVRRNDDQKSPENPFYYLRNDGFWEAVEIESGVERPLANTPTVGQANAGTVFARFIDGLEDFVGTPKDRALLRDAVVSRFFPHERARLSALFAEPAASPTAADESEPCRDEPLKEYGGGRDPAFRRIVLEAYDFQCAACGLRIKLPDADLTFVDGAHLIPFKDSRNDHPTNGLALCKNHHWAMDRFLLVPTPNGLWKASTRLDARRSPGEQALVALHDQPLLPPHDDAFRSRQPGLARGTRLRLAFSS